MSGKHSWWLSLETKLNTTWPWQPYFGRSGPYEQIMLHVHFVALYLINSSMCTEPYFSCNESLFLCGLYQHLHHLLVAIPYSSEDSQVQRQDCRVHRLSLLPLHRFRPLPACRATIVSLHLQSHHGQLKEGCCSYLTSSLSAFSSFLSCRVHCNSCLLDCLQ